MIDMDLREVVEMIRGKKGTVVRLHRPAPGRARPSASSIAIVRDKIDLRSKRPS